MKRFFLMGLLVWVPLGITFWVLGIVVNTLDSTLTWLPHSLHAYISPYILPGTGVALTLVVVFITGVLTSNFIGQKVIHFWDAFLKKIPFVKTIYSSVKQVSDSMLSDSSQAFSKALLVEYPRSGVWTIAFLTGEPSSLFKEHMSEACLSLYVPTTPNPTSGFLLLVPKSQVIDLNISVDEALKYVLSMGLAHPDFPVPDELKKRLHSN